ncbi:MAG: hypothetical protein IGQ45_00665 [Cyanobacterium sp. T60_A2020_053]|nr:hypothetical protein [Cyanobacterium sp. T60_A2020_053]
MAGLFSWLRRNPNPNSKKGAYFLEPDDAKTYGDIDYMRKVKTVRRTFPKTYNSDGAELIQDVSSEKMVKKTGFQAQKSYDSVKTDNSVESSSFNSEPSFQPSNPQKNRSTDTNMDMFRKMAKGIKK